MPSGAQQKQDARIVDGRQLQSDFARWRVFARLRNHEGHEREMMLWAYAPTAEEACAQSATQLATEAELGRWKWFSIEGCKYEPKRDKQ